MKSGAAMVLVALLLGSCGPEKEHPAPPAPLPPARGPDVLLITMDTTRADHLGCYGYTREQSPNIDTLAKEGVLFEEAFSVQPVTLPAHTSIHTGKYPFAHGVRDNNLYRLGQEHETMAELLAAGGRITGAFVASYVLHHRFGLDQGFDYYNDRFVKPRQEGRLPVDRRAHEVSYLAGEWLDALEKELSQKPFFLWLHYYDPHAVYDPPHPFATAFANPYDGEIAFMDDWIGYVFDGLKRRGRWDNTLVVLLADHGEALGDHGENTHGMFIYRATTRVPLIVKFPGGKHGGRRVAQRVSQVDVLPTVLDVLALKAPRGMQGRSLLPLLSGAEKEDRDAYSETFIPRSFNWSDLKGLRKGHSFYIDAPRPEFYDISHRGSEGENLLSSRPAEVRALADALSALVSSVAPADAAGVDLSDEETGRLEALGYFIASAAPDPRRPEGLPDPKDRVALFNAQQQANQMAAAGRLEEAIAEYRRLHDEDLSNPRFLLELAQLEDDGGHVDDALRSYKEALRADPRNGRAHYLMGRLQERSGDIGGAVASLERAVELSPLDDNYRFALARVLIHANDIVRARFLLEELIRRRPTAAAWNNLGYLAIVGEGRVEEGIAHIRRAVELAGDRAPFLISLGSALLHHGSPQEAATALEEALSLVPDSAQAIELLRQVYGKLGNEEKLRDLRRRAALIDEDPFSWTGDGRGGARSLPSGGHR